MLITGLNETLKSATLLQGLPALTSCCQWSRPPQVTACAYRQATGNGNNREKQPKPSLLHENKPTVMQPQLYAGVRSEAEQVITQDACFQANIVSLVVKESVGTLSVNSSRIGASVFTYRLAWALFCDVEIL